MNDAQLRRAVARKRDGDALEEALWVEIVRDVVADRADEAAIAALLMACVLRGLDDDETGALTRAFIESGERMRVADERTMDKHSSGGVADTASLVVVPLVAACGVPVAKLSGRALGHTGGTLDKLEAVPGVRTDIAPERFFAIVGRVGCAIAAQSERLVPADKRLYALRDRTSTVPSRGLIAASIVAKKIAGGAHAIVYDVKSGNGAFTSSMDDARALAQTLVTSTRRFGRRAHAIVSDMNEPLGSAIGTGLEVIEARELLRGNRRGTRLAALCSALGVRMLALAGIADGSERVARALESGAAFATFEAMLAAQGADADALDRLRPHARSREIAAARSGFVARIATPALGEIARDLVSAYGARAGVRTHVRVGDAVAAGDVLATAYGDASPDAAIGEAFDIAETAARPLPLIAYETDSDSAGVAGSSAADSTLERR